MQKDSRFFEDLSKMAGTAAGGMFEMKREFDALVAHQLEKLLRHMNLVTKEEAESLREMAAKLRTEQEELKKRLNALEKAQK
jgi:BMFP domain-containing protein YqiC